MGMSWRPIGSGRVATARRHLGWRPMTRALLLALLLSPAVARADEKPVLSFEARAGLLVMGADRPTGGGTLGAGARYLHPFGEAWGGYAGIGASVVAPNDGWHWMGVLAAPEAGAWRAAGPWDLSAGLGLPMGQISTCTDWGLCIRSWGLYPEAVGRVAYRVESFRIGIELGAL